jgi:hypothetical protein
MSYFFYSTRMSADLSCLTWTGLARHLRSAAVGATFLFSPQRFLPSGNLVEVYLQQLRCMRRAFRPGKRPPADSGLWWSGGVLPSIRKTSFLNYHRGPYARAIHLPPSPCGAQWIYFPDYASRDCLSSEPAHGKKLFRYLDHGLRSSIGAPRPARSNSHGRLVVSTQ